MYNSIKTISNLYTFRSKLLTNIFVRTFPNCLSIYCIAFTSTCQQLLVNKLKNLWVLLTHNTQSGVCSLWHPEQDSNLRRLSQSQLCYHYTIREQKLVPRDRIELPSAPCKDAALPLDERGINKFVSSATIVISTIHPCNKLERDSVRHLGY